MSPAVSGVLSDLDRVLLDSVAIQARVAAMAAAIEKDFAGQMLTVIIIMDGALFFVADLLRAIGLPLRIVSVSASSYHGGTKSTGAVRLPWPPDMDLQGRHVLLLDDILDTGLTLGAVHDRLRKERVASLKTGVLLKKRRVQAREVPLDYIGFEIEDEFVVGYGMDYQGWFRNLPCIGILKL
ncbi:MAG: hpt [Verrucomicrobiaceae bacterium]|nr:hpt [Verrucomicrobiaceae bacterium]